MTEQSGSSNPLDLSKMIGELDPTKIMEQFSKSLSEYQIPGVDLNSVLESQRKNMEALATANKQVLESIQAVATRQSEILSQTMDEASTAIKELSAAGSAEEITSKQAELIKRAVEKAMSNMRGLAELSTKSSTEVFQTINSRLTESLRDIRQLAHKLQK